MVSDAKNRNSWFSPYLLNKLSGQNYYGQSGRSDVGHHLTIFRLSHMILRANQIRLFNPSKPKSHESIILPFDWSVISSTLSSQLGVLSFTMYIFQILQIDAFWKIVTKLNYRIYVVRFKESTSWRLNYDNEDR